MVFLLHSKIPVEQTPILEQTAALVCVWNFFIGRTVAWRALRLRADASSASVNEQPSPPHQRFIAAVIVIGRFRVDSPPLAGYLLARADSCAMAIAR